MLGEIPCEDLIGDMRSLGRNEAGGAIVYGHGITNYHRYKMRLHTQIEAM